MTWCVFSDNRMESPNSSALLYLGFWKPQNPPQKRLNITFLIRTRRKNEDIWKRNDTAFYPRAWTLYVNLGNKQNYCSLQFGLQRESKQMDSIRGFLKEAAPALLYVLLLDTHTHTHTRHVWLFLQFTIEQFPGSNLFWHLNPNNRKETLRQNMLRYVSLRLTDSTFGLICHLRHVVG